MAVAELFVNAGEAVGKGDLGQMDVLLEKMSGWRQMLMLRHAVRMEELRADAPVPQTADAIVED